jgi:hypothetical protein
MMIKKRIVLFCFILFVGLTATVAYALPSKCLQALERQNACPHLLYKRAALSLALLGVEKGDVICICLSDFKGLRNITMSKVESIEQHVTLQKLFQMHQLSEPNILTLIIN